jgi:hypothetical protein
MALGRGRRYLPGMVTDLILLVSGALLIPLGLGLLATGHLSRGGAGAVVTGGAFVVLAIARWRYRRQHAAGS